MKCIIIDDEEIARVILEKLISNNKNLDLVNSFNNPIEALKYLNQNSVDLLFLDIHMPAFTGFDLLQTLKNPPKVILISSHANFALEAFEYNSVVDFLEKPINQIRFDKAVDKAKLFFNSKIEIKDLPVIPANEDSKSDLYVNIYKRLVKISYDSINLIEAKGDYILIKTDKENYTVHSTLKKIEDKLPDAVFLKVHRSFIINIKKIVDIEDSSVLIGKNVVPVSRSSKPELMKRLNLL
ncbi:LytTR family DNA-binding domain-containing protein [Lutibacter sp.]|uniref:LytR/AlgR family response regulator transcription factor n=1 Tax=Lutibacter sp. TaxID=1925666 RepID=UPI0027344113|nr:LytTR family DNA-binding domain-containing protein [Lutibacter sp.]MDP3312200.1 LytTR family DNA-binding domain-containing protein [Lutibacter sp.]